METNTIVIGASAAGLAVSACLTQQHTPYILLEKEQQVATSWRNHYERLHLHTDRKHSELPHMPMPKSYPKYPSRLQVVEYLEAYAQEFAIQPRFGQEVTAVEPTSEGWQVQTQDQIYTAQNVVIATGHTRVPNVPHWNGEDGFSGAILHSSQYRNGESFIEKNVLIVGFGNSAGEIAIDLTEHGAKDVGMAVRSGVNVIPRDIFGLPILTIAILLDYLPPKLADVLAWPMLKMTIGDLTKYGLPKLPYGPNVQVRQDGKNPLLDIGTVRLIKNGRIQIHPGIDRFDNDTVIFTDGSARPFDAIILATGYKPKINDFLPNMEQILDEDGWPKSSGAEAAPGLYFCGFYVSPTGILREIGIEAMQISEDIAKKNVMRDA